MDDLIHKNKALNIINQFYEAEYIIWVEGDDDELFWNYIFELNNYNNYKIKKANGKERLKGYMEKIIEKNLKIIVACDRDYNDFNEQQLTHDRVIYTFGNSIENTLYCPYTIARNIEKYSKTKYNNYHEIENWYDKFYDDIKDLIVLDIANIKYDKEIEVMGKSSKKFLASNKSVLISTKKVENHINNIVANFTKDEISSTRDQVKNYPKKKRHIIKGHFLTDAIRNLIIKKAKSERNKDTISISNDSLYSNTVDGCLKCRLNCEEKEYLNLLIKHAIESIKNYTT